MCSVSLRPVMKITGTWARCSIAFRRRQASKPPIPGIIASIRMRSGVICSVRLSALSPSSATSTVAPVVSIAWVRKPSVSGESSTTRTMSRGAFWVFGSMLGIGRVHHGLHACHVLLQLEIPHQDTEIVDQRRVLGAGGDHLVELDLDAAHIADLAEPVQVVEMHQRN